jgi:hydrogenase maturation protease
MTVMFKARGGNELVWVDASNSDGERGAVYQVPGGRLESMQEPRHGLRGFRWDHAVHTDRKIYGSELPASVTVCLIEGQTLELGVGLSEPVERAVIRVVELVVNGVRSR